jgi:hypothetical protein
MSYQIKKIQTTCGEDGLELNFIRAIILLTVTTANSKVSARKQDRASASTELRIEITYSSRVIDRNLKGVCRKCQATKNQVTDRLLVVAIRSGKSLRNAVLSHNEVQPVKIRLIGVGRGG